MHIIPINIGDFCQHTQRFKPMHIGIFMSLLFEYYKTEKALSADPADLEFIAGVETKSERDALTLVLKRCFVLSEDGKTWIQRRCERELAAFRTSGVQKRYAILCRFWDSVNPGVKKPTLEQFTRNVPLYYDESTRRIRSMHGKNTLELQAYDSSDTSLPIAKHDTETRNQKTENSNQNTPIVPKGTDTTSLPDWLKLAEAIYAIYPKKVGKTAALKAIEKILKAGTLTELELQASVRAYAAAVSKWPEQDKTFVPHPATWFNQGRYADDPATWIRHADSNTQNPPQKKKGAGAAAPLIFDDAPTGNELGGPNGWREMWPELFAGHCPDAWIDVPQSARHQLVAELAKKNKGGARP